MTQVQPKNDGKEKIFSIYKPVAIPLLGFQYVHAPQSDNSLNRHLFVGREKITSALVDILKCEARKRGSYLLAGYRGVGKTSVLNNALDKYKNGRTSKPLEIRINLGDNSQLTPFDIYFSIVNFIQIELKKKTQWRWSHYGWRIAWWKPLSKAKREINLLIDFMSNEITNNTSATLGSKAAYGIPNVIANVQATSTRKRIHITAREVEEKLFDILKNLHKDKRMVIFIFDEIDKLSDSEELFEHSLISNIAGNPISDKMLKINTLLGALKNFVTSAHATFFFISGRETLDRYYSEKGSPNSLYESLFDRVFEIPSFLTERGQYNRNTQVSALIEEYLCRRLRPICPVDVSQAVYYTLKDWHKFLKESDAEHRKFVDENTIAYQRYVNENSAAVQKKNEEETSQQEILKVALQNAPLLISTLRSFIYYLTFHSWGNPKRLGAILESYVLPANNNLHDTNHSWGNLKRLGAILESYVLPANNNLDDTKSGIANPCKHDDQKFNQLLFNINSLRSFSLASELVTLFQNQFSREVASSDKLTVTSLASLQFILKHHSYGFSRESLHRMSEAMNVHRSPELNTIIDDLLTQTFKSYIRRVRNGASRYRFHSGFEQELRYISYVAELESSTYNFSHDAMKHVKHFFEATLARIDPKEIGVIARMKFTLGDICALEQSYIEAAMHYSSVKHHLASQLIQSPDDIEILINYAEAMVKYGDLEEHRQSYSQAAAIYSEAERVIKNYLTNKTNNEVSRLVGIDKTNFSRLALNEDSKWDILKQPFWAGQYLSLKRSPPTTYIIPSSSYFYSEGDPRMKFRAANLAFFLNESQKAQELYNKTIELVKKKTCLQNKSQEAQNDYNEAIEIIKKKTCSQNESREAQNDYNEAIEIIKKESCSQLDERNAYLVGNSLVSIAESILVCMSKILFKLQDAQNSSFPSPAYNNCLKKFIREQFDYIGESVDKYTELSGETKGWQYSTDKGIIILLIDAANLFEVNRLYISAAITHMKLISYIATVLDAFDYELIDDAEWVSNVCGKFDEMVRISGNSAIRCINKARQLETSQSCKTLSVQDFAVIEKSDHLNVHISQLFETLLGTENNAEYLSDEQPFWQQSLWAHKLASMLLWAKFVSRKINDKTVEIDRPIIMPNDLSTFSVRSAILMRWIYARDLSVRHIDKKLICYDSVKGCAPHNALFEYVKQNGNVNNVSLTADANSFIQNIDQSKTNLNLANICDVLSNAYKIARNLYFAIAAARIISRKNMDLIFPSKSHIYFNQWKLLSNLTAIILIDKVKSRSIEHTEFITLRGISYALQNAFIAIDKEAAPHERIPPSYFDYEYIYINLMSSLDSAINLVDKTSRTRTGIFQNKYYCQDDYSDAEFHNDYTLAYMFTVSAKFLRMHVKETHKRFEMAIRIANQEIKTAADKQACPEPQY